MAMEKYGKYITKGINSDILFPDHQTIGPIRFIAGELFKDSKFKIGFEKINHPWIMDPYPLKHFEADQILVFMCSDSADSADFDAEIEFSLGEEQEKYIITKPTMIYVPRGLAHCPLNFKRIGKPVMFVNMIFGNYTRLVFRDNEWKEYKDIPAERAGTPFEIPKT